MSTSEGSPLELPVGVPCRHGKHAYRSISGELLHQGEGTPCEEIELPCCEAGKSAYPDPCPWHPGEIKLPAAPPKEETAKQIVERVFREMGIEPENRRERYFPMDADTSASVEFPLEDISPDAAKILLGAGEPRHAYRPPEKPVPYLGDRMVVPWGVIIFFMALALSCAAALGWSLSELGIL